MTSTSMPCRSRSLAAVSSSRAASRATITRLSPRCGKLGGELRTDAGRRAGDECSGHPPSLATRAAGWLSLPALVPGALAPLPPGHGLHARVSGRHPGLMDVFIHWAGFLGAWLLVAGPLLQGVIELRDEELDREGMAGFTGDADLPPRVSRWWWLLPPVAYYKNRKRRNGYRRRSLASLTVEQRAQFVGFSNKATGWFTVAGGAFLIALKETWELAEIYELPGWVYALAVVVLAVAAVANTVVRLSRSDRMIHVDDPDYQAKQRAQRTAAMARRKERPMPHQRTAVSGSGRACPAGVALPGRQPDRQDRVGDADARRPDPDSDRSGAGHRRRRSAAAGLAGGAARPGRRPRRPVAAEPGRAVRARRQLRVGRSGPGRARAADWS